MTAILGVLILVVVAVVAFKIFAIVAHIVIRLALFLALIGLAIYIGWRYIL